MHRSTGDWDFNPSTAWQLDTARYVSSPSSWRAYGYAPTMTRALAKTTVVPIAYVKEGRIVNWIWWRQETVNGIAHQMQFLFRWQDSGNFYFIRIERLAVDKRWRVGKWVGGVETILRSVTRTKPPNFKWWKFRFTWWNDAAGLVVRVEHLVDSTWTQLFPDTYDSANEWSTVGGRVGYEFMPMGMPGPSGNVDDTEIWGFTG